MPENGGASFLIKNTVWKDTSPGTSISYPNGNVTSSATSGRYLLESVHARHAPGAYTARVEEGDTVHGAGPFRTQRRSQIAAQSLADRVESGAPRAERYFQQRYH